MEVVFFAGKVCLSFYELMYDEEDGNDDEVVVVAVVVIVVESNCVAEDSSSIATQPTVVDVF